MKITLSDEELQSGQLSPETLQRAIHLFKIHGFLSIENLFTVSFIETLYESYRSQLTLNEEGTEILNGACVGHRRYIVPIEFRAPFNAPHLYANPFLLQIYKHLLGPFFRLSSIGSVTSLPGAMDQHLHADHMPLFPERRELEGQISPYAITISIPLIDVDLLNGPTKVWSGSHLVSPINLDVSPYTRHLLYGKKGSCHLWDFRVFHAGGSNLSDEPRPLLYLSATRSWFRDMLNSDEMRIPQEEFEKLSEEHRKLLKPETYKYTQTT